MIFSILNRGLNLSLRYTVPEDAPLLYEKLYSNYQLMRLFRLSDKRKTLEDVREKLVQRSLSTPDKTRTLECMIVHHDHGPVGVVLATSYSSIHQKTELLIAIFPSQFSFVTYGVEATLLMMDLVFNAYQLHKLYAYIYDYNQKSQKIMKTAGCRLEGVLVDDLYDADSKKFIDVHIYAMLRDEFHGNSFLSRLSKRLLGRDICCRGQAGSRV